MKIVSTYRRGYQILKIDENLTLNSDITDLRTIVEDYVQKGPINIALEFTKDSYLYTKSIAVLVQCLETIQEHGGRMAVIAPNRDIVDVLETIGFINLVKIYGSEEDVGKG
jgi:anti-anti-sigma factor